MGRYPDTLKLGSKGTVVKWLQSLLIGAGHAISISGSFDATTLTAVTAYQGAKKLKVDGIVGPASWGELLPFAANYKQMDSRWGKVPYTSTGNKTQTISSSGCGPACTAMIAATWGNPYITPKETCADAVAGGYRTKNDGTAHAYFPAFAKKYGYKCRETKDINAVLAALKKGALVVGNMGPGYWTKGGHFILFWVHDPYSDMLYANDPGSSSRYRASRASVAKEAKKYFIFER